MIRFHALGVRFTLPLLTLIFPPLAFALGMRGTLGSLILALCVHEAAHVIAAKAADVAITEIRLTPFGGSAHMENPYGVPGLRMIPVAAAGPAANLLMAVCIAALMHWNVLNVRAAHCIQPNLVLFLFNLLPALPLDGGRILYALLQRPLGESCALSLGIWLGRLLALGLVALSTAGRMMGGKWNLSFMLAAVFIISSAHDERKALFRSRAQRLNAILDEENTPMPVRFYQLDESATARSALSLLRPRERAWFIVTRNGQPCSLFDDRSIIHHIFENGAADAMLKEMHIAAPFPLSCPAAPKRPV